MERTTQHDQTIIRYLLNELSVEDKMRFEEAYLEDDNLYERLRILEEELIEDYARGDLSGRERRLFERHYLASEQRQTRIEEARQIVQMCSANSPEETSADDSVARSWLGLLTKQPLLLGFIVAAALLLIVSVGSVTQMVRLRGRLVEVSEERIALVRQAEEAERQLAREREQLTEEREQAIALRKELGDVTGRLGRLEQEMGRSQPKDNQIVSLELAQGARDGNTPYKAVISNSTRFVELHVILEKQDATTPATYRASVKTVVGDKEIWKQEGIKLQHTTSAMYLVFRVPARRFRMVEGRGFTLTIEAPAAGGKHYEELESCYFQVISR